MTIFNIKNHENFLHETVAIKLSKNKDGANAHRKIENENESLLIRAVQSYIYHRFIFKIQIDLRLNLNYRENIFYVIHKFPFS